MAEGSGSTELVKGAKIGPFALFSPEQTHASPPAQCQTHGCWGKGWEGPRVRAQCNEIRPDKLLCERQVRMGNSRSEAYCGVHQKGWR